MAVKSSTTWYVNILINHCYTYYSFITEVGVTTTITTTNTIPATLFSTTSTLLVCTAHM